MGTNQGRKVYQNCDKGASSATLWVIKQDCTQELPVGYPLYQVWREWVPNRVDKGLEMTMWVLIIQAIFKNNVYPPLILPSTQPCTTRLDPCGGNPCQNGGSCFESASQNGFFCRCTSAYIGDTCTIPGNINLAQPSNCRLTPPPLYGGWGLCSSLPFAVRSS